MTVWFAYRAPETCGHEHATKAEAVACMEALDWAWYGEADHWPLQAGEQFTAYNRYPYQTGGETIDLSAFFSKR